MPKSHSWKGAAAMDKHFYLRTLLLLSLILASSHLQIPLESAETDEQLESDIRGFFEKIYDIHKHLGFHTFVTYPGSSDLKPSLEQRLMERFSVPIYTVGSKNGPLNHRYLSTETMVITFFSGLEDPTLTVLNDTELAWNKLFFSFFYVPPRHDSRLLTTDEIRRFFVWCWELTFDRVMLFLRGKSEFETWTYVYLQNITIIRLTADRSLDSMLREHEYRLTVQAANDLPSIFWYNSSEQADVIGGGNISLSGPVGILMVEFMRHMNASMDVLPIQEAQNSNYDILQRDARVDIVANLVVNDSLLFSPVLTDSQLCLVVPRRRKIPPSRFFDKVVNPSVHFLFIPMGILVFVIKYIAHRCRSLVDSFFNTMRFSLGIPLPGGQLDRLPLADKILEVYSLLFLTIVISICGSFLSSALTAGVYYPPITDVASMRDSGLRIITLDPTIKPAFEDNQLPSSLLDLVDVVDYHTIYKHLNELNDSYVYVIPTPNWRGLAMYQERLKNKRLSIAGPELCSNPRHLRLPVSPYSPLRFNFKNYFNRIFESGLEQKWLKMGFQKYREVYDLSKLPMDKGDDWKPLTLSYYVIYMRVYIGGMLLSTLVFIIELLYKRYHG